MSSYSPLKRLLNNARKHVLALHPLPRGAGKAWEPLVRHACRRLVQELTLVDRGLLQGGLCPGAWTPAVVAAAFGVQEAVAQVVKPLVGWRLKRRGLDEYMQDPSVKSIRRLLMHLCL